MRSQATADVYVSRLYAFGVEDVLKLVDALAKACEDVEVEDAASDVEMESLVAHVGQRLAPAYGGHHILHGYAELVLVQACRNLLVGMGIHVGVYAESHTRRLPHFYSQFANALKLGQALDVEHADACFQGQADLPIGLANTCKHDALGRKTGFDSRFYLAATHAVGTKACLGNDAEKFWAGVSLYGIVDMYVALVRTRRIQGGKGRAQQLCVVVVAGGL